jgi:hypothetical protein
MDRHTARDQVERLLNSEELAGKDQLKKLLDFLFKSMELQAVLKPGRVIKELWPDQAETKRSSDLATEMSRLRRALECYYNGPGKADGIVIHLPSRARPAQNGARGNRWITIELRRVAAEEAAPETGAAPHPVEIAPPVTPHERKTQRPRIWWIGAMAVIAILVYAAVRLLAQNPVPSSGRIDGTVLSIFDSKGKELWRKGFPNGFWQDYYSKGLATRIWFGDLNDDGNAEVLLLYYPAVNPTSHSTMLICYSDRGEEKWRWTPGRALPEISGSPTVFSIAAFGVTKPRNHQPRRIVLSSNHFPYYPNQIAMVSPDGKTISEYWHSGHLDYMTLADLDGDGREEIIATGISNGYHQATMVVLDPDRVFGASTEAERPEIQLHGMGTGKEQLRILLPRSDLNRATLVYNRALEASVDRDRIQVPVRECELVPDCDVFYEFDKSFNLLSTKASDAFRSAHTEFYLKPSGGHAFDQNEENAFRNIRCLAGCGSNLFLRPSR